MTFKPRFFVVLFLTLSIVCSNTQGFAAFEKEASFQLQRGDRVEVTVYREDDLTGTYEIDPSGVLTFPLIGELQVSGLRIDELIELLTTKLRKYLISPQVRVSRAEGTIKSISVLGRVMEPGAFDFSPGLTLMRLISQAGGFGLSANKRKVRLVRMINGKKESSIINTQKIIKGDAQDPALKPGDMVFVAEAIF